MVALFKENEVKKRHEKMALYPGSLHIRIDESNFYVSMAWQKLRQVEVHFTVFSGRLHRHIWNEPVSSPSFILLVITIPLFWKHSPSSVRVMHIVLLVMAIGITIRFNPGRNSMPKMIYQPENASLLNLRCLIWSWITRWLPWTLFHKHC